MTARICQRGRVRDLSRVSYVFFKLLILCVVYHDLLLKFQNPALLIMYRMQCTSFMQ